MASRTSGPVISRLSVSIWPLSSPLATRSIDGYYVWHVGTHVLSDVLRQMVALGKGSSRASTFLAFVFERLTDL